MSIERARVLDQLAQVEQDLRELAEQVAVGELDEDTAAALRATYESEARYLTSALEADELEPAGVSRASGRSPRRMMAGAAVLILGGALAVFGVVQMVEDRPAGGSATGGAVGDAGAGQGIDLATITNEQMEVVVAQNPNVPSMRAALARRYFEAGEFDKALDHYLVVLDQEENPEALANVGWMTYLSDRADVAEPFVERALEIQPDYPQAYWYLANIRLIGLGDATGAIEPLETLLDYDLPDDVRVAADELLTEARSGG